MSIINGDSKNELIEHLIPRDYLKYLLTIN